MKKGWSYLSWFTLLLFWFILFYTVDHRLILPSPLDVLLALGSLAGEGSSFAIMGLSLIRLLVAVSVSAILGIVLGFFAGVHHHISQLMHPYLTLLRTIPIISIVVILMILLGYQVTPYVLTFLMVFPLIYQATEDGIKQIDKKLIDVYRLETHNLNMAFRYLYLPLIKPFIILALIQSFGLGLKVLVMAEYLSQTKHSIGQALYLAKTNLAYDEVFAWTLILILLSVFFEALINRYKKHMIEG